MEKYGVKVKGSAQNNLDSFIGREESAVPLEDKNWVNDQLNEVYYYASIKKEYENGYGYFHLLGWPVVALFSLTLLMQIYSTLGLRDLLISAGLAILTAVGTVATTASFSNGPEPLLFISLVIYLCSVLVAFNGRTASVYKPIHAFSAAFSGFFTAFLPFLVLMIGTVRSSATPETGLAAMLLGCLLYGLFVAPVFWSLQAHIRALPRR